MRSRQLRYLVLVVLVMLVSGAALTGWAFMNSTGGAHLWLARTWPSVFGKHQGELMLLGNVDVRQVNLAFKIEGRVSRMVFEEGDEVNAGQVVASLEKEDFEDAVRLAEAQMHAQAAALAELANGTRPEEIAQARTFVTQYEAMLNDARLIFSRREELAARNFASHEAHENARAAMLVIGARLKAAQETLKLAEAGPRSETIERARAQLRANEVALDMARRKLSDADIVAPSSGIIQTRVREPGAIVRPGETIYNLALTSPVWVRTFVEEPDLGRIHPGMPAIVLTDSGGRYDGRIGLVSPVAEFTPKTVETRELRSNLVYRLRVIVDVPDRQLRQGMPVTVVVHPDEARRSAELRHE
ncbi:MAG: efflux RND transporter periplasmic adaptor subunit [Rhodospirillales bacterium]|nr:efflux RND transporter periplasmic adaptor subunit [Rhodospirillales bacterium]